MPPPLEKHLFRPCIDLHGGRVKQIVGGTLRDGAEPSTNFETDRSPAHFALQYRRDDLQGGHVVLLGPGNEDAARQALAAWPGGMQLGGGVTPRNARDWIEAGASHVVVTSYVFREGRVDRDRLRELVDAVGSERLVLDLSCRQRDGARWIVTDRWQRFSDVRLDAETLEALADSAAEFLVHAADVEGRREGVDEGLVELLGEASPIPVTYAGGVRSLEDFERVHHLGGGRVALTVGSALDLFGGSLSYRALVARARDLAG